MKSNYKIIVDGREYECVIPCYVYYNAKIESFMTCSEDEAEAVLVNIDNESVYCDIEGNSHTHDGFPVAKIVKI